MDTQSFVLKKIYIPTIYQEIIYFYEIYVIYNFDKHNMNKFYLLCVKKKHSKCVELFKFMLLNNFIFDII